jgi:hypothetical protein
VLLPTAVDSARFVFVRIYPGLCLRFGNLLRADFQEQVSQTACRLMFVMVLIRTVFHVRQGHIRELVEMTKQATHAEPNRPRILTD